jgi:hypothetical protein
MRGNEGHGTLVQFIHSHEEKGDGRRLRARWWLLWLEEDGDRGVGYDGPEDRWV